MHPHKAIKKQCLDAVKYLKTVMPIERAKMELQLQYSPRHTNDVQSALSIHNHRLIRSNNSDDQNTVVLQVDPSLYRDFSALMSQVNGNLEILEQVVMSREGEIDLEQQLEINNRKQQESAQAKSLPDSNDDGPDSDVEDIVEKLQTLRTTGPANNENNRDAILGMNQDDNGGDDDDFYSGSSARKNNKKNKKKSKKQRRREQEEEEELQRLAESESRRVAERQNEVSEVALANAKTMESTQAVAGNKSCNTCGGSFANAAEYRAHFRSDWHRFNQKLKLKGVTPVSEEEFLLCDAETFFS